MPIMTHASGYWRNAGECIQQGKAIGMLGLKLVFGAHSPQSRHVHGEQ